jgi:hypothetical protein
LKYQLEATLPSYTEDREDGLVTLLDALEQLLQRLYEADEATGAR